MALRTLLIAGAVLVLMVVPLPLLVPGGAKFATPSAQMMVTTDENMPPR